MDDGEPKGKRNLVRWDDDKDKQLLLCLQYACVKAGIRIPWENVATQMGPKFSGGACVQHLAKLRNRMSEEGISVPPPLPRGMVTTTPSRVYSQVTSNTKRRRGANTDDDVGDIEPLNPVSASPKPAKKRKVVKKEPGVKEESDRENMPDLYDSDGEYGAKKPKRATKPKCKKGANKCNTRRNSDSQSVVGGNEITPTPAVQTRGIRKNYAQMQGPIDEEDDVMAALGETEETVENADADSGDVATAFEAVKAENTPTAARLNETPVANVANDMAQQSIDQDQSMHTGGLKTPKAAQSDNTQIVRRQAVANTDPFNFQDMGSNHGSRFNPQWAYGGALSSTFTPYHMAQNNYMNGAPSQFMYNNAHDSIDNDQKLDVGDHFDTFPNTPTTQFQMGFKANASSGLTRAALLAQPTSFSINGNTGDLTNFNFGGNASHPSTRTNSKESIISQDTLLGLPSQGNSGAGEELSLTLFGDAGAEMHDAEFDSMIDFD